MHADPTDHLIAGWDDEARLRSFAQALDQVHRRVASEVGDEDLRRVRRVGNASSGCEIAGRLLLQFCFEPFGFSLGVVLLWLRKQLHMLEIGHTALHATYDNIGGGRRFSAATFRWDAPIDEACWRYGHNHRHHSGTNVAGVDAEIHLGPVRMTYQTAHHPIYRLQVVQMLGLILPGFLFWMGAHYAGLVDLICGNCRPEGFDFLPDRSWRSVKLALKQCGRKWVPYYAKNYLFFPALAGSGFAKVLLGNVLADLLCNLYSGLAILVSHNAAAETYPSGTKATSRGAWCAMQVESTNNIAVSYPLSVLMGAVDCQIEHHLFPKLPPERLRQIAPQVQAICGAHGITYRREPWGRLLRQVFAQMHRLAKPGGKAEVFAPLSWTSRSVLLRSSTAP